jgi:Protein of unknown function (DUF2874).
MKKLIFIVAPLVLLTSCDLFEDLFEDDDNPCEVVEEESVLQVVKDSLEGRYPGAVPVTWFNKDNTGYCVTFGLDQKEVTALFNNNGNFMWLHEDEEEDDDHGSGCECEIDD